MATFSLIHPTNQINDARPDPGRTYAPRGIQRKHIFHDAINIYELIPQMRLINVNY